MQNVEFFKSKKQLNHIEYRDLSLALTYETHEPGSEIASYGSRPDKFYIILSGVVSVLVRNEIIDHWDWAMSIYNALKDWKEREFDKRVQREM